MPITVISVHGTFAKDSAWPALRKGLAGDLRKSGRKVRFSEVNWSGRNTYSGRMEAAAKIDENVRATIASYPDEDIVLLGHSHGGSAIAYFVKNYPATLAKVRGAVFLSTPFVALRPRSNFLEVIPLVLALPLLIAWILVNPFIANATGIGLQWMSAISGMAILSAVGLLMWSLEKSGASILRECRKRETAKLPPGNYLFMRFTGDEAAAMLSTIQFSAWTTTNILRFFHSVASWIYQRDLAIGLVIAFAFIFVLVLADYWGKIAPWNLRMWAALVYADVAVGGWLGFGGAVFTIVALTVGFAAAACAATILVTVLVQAGANIAFGFSSVKFGILVEAAVEPAPFGTHELVHVSWRRSEKYSSLTHSAGYSNPDAFPILSNWILKASHNVPQQRPKRRVGPRRRVG